MVVYIHHGSRFHLPNTDPRIMAYPNDLLRATFRQGPKQKKIKYRYYIQTRVLGNVLSLFLSSVQNIIGWGLSLSE